MAYQQNQQFPQVQQFQQQPQFPQQQQSDIVSGEQYRYALTNFRLAHEKVEEQRVQLEEQERQVAQLRARIQLLEGGNSVQRHGKTGNTVDDFSIRNAASQLDKLINRWAAEMVRSPPAPLLALRDAILADVAGGSGPQPPDVSSMQLSCFLRHAISETISEGIINCLIVTNSSEANVQLTRIHEHIFARDPTVACVWRRQTFSAAVETCTPEMFLGILYECLPTFASILNNILPNTSGTSLLESAYEFSRMLHGSGSSADDAFYRAFVPELGSTLYPRQIELVKRCLKSEKGEVDKVGATTFPGLVKVTRGVKNPDGTVGDNVQTVVRRAQVICECAMNSTGGQVPPPHQQHAHAPPHQQRLQQHHSAPQQQHQSQQVPQQQQTQSPFHQQLPMQHGQQPTPAATPSVQGGPLPGTPMYGNAGSHGLLPTNGQANYGGAPPNMHGLPLPGQQFGSSPQNMRGSPSPHQMYGGPSPNLHGSPPPGQANYGSPPPTTHGSPGPQGYSSPPPHMHGSPLPGSQQSYGQVPSIHAGSPPPGSAPNYTSGPSPPNVLGGQAYGVQPPLFGGSPGPGSPRLYGGEQGQGVNVHGGYR